MLGEHRIHDADEGLVAVEKAVAAGEQIPFQHTLTDVLGEHGVHDAAGGGEMLVSGEDLAGPGTVGFLKDGGEPVGGGFIGTERAEVARIGVQAVDLAHKVTEGSHILRFDGAGEGDIHGKIAEVRHAQVTQQLAAVGVGVGAHAADALGRQLAQLLDRRAVLVEELLGAVAPEPLLDLADVLFAVRLNGHLMRAPVILDLRAVHIVRPGPALGRAKHDHRPARTLGHAVLTGGALIFKDGGNALVQRVGHLAVHFGGIAALNKVGLPAAADEEALQFLMRDARENGGIGDLVAVEVQDGQHRAVCRSGEKLVELPTGGERTGFGLAVAHNAGRDQSGVVRHGTESVGKGVAQLAALVDGAGGLGGDMRGDAAGEREALE